MGSIPAQDLPQPWVKTPLIESSALSKAAGCRIFLKLENLQPSGSFKSRGIGHLILSHILANSSRPNLHFYSSSGGNAGLACVTAARALGHPASVIVPITTSPFMIAKIRTAGASQVLQVGANWKEADTYLREEVLPRDPEGVYVPPFDDERIWEGAASMVEEMNTQLHGEAPDAIIGSVGGGGLFCGLMRGLDRQTVSWKNVTVLAMETQGADSLHQALAAGKVVTLPRITSIATSLGATAVAEQAFMYGQRANVKSVVLSDAEAAMGCWRFADDERILVEPACGVNLALCYDGRLKKLLPGLGGQSKVVIVVCGGSAISLDILKGYKEKFGDVEQKLEVNEDVPSTVSAPR